MRKLAARISSRRRRSGGGWLDPRRTVRRSMSSDGVLEQIQRDARHVYWLNPEPVAYWDTGDSIASACARFVDEMVEVCNLRQLVAFVERI